MNANADRIDPSPEGRAAFERYIDAFNEGDIARFTSFYKPDMKLKLATRVLNGPQEIAAFYEKMYEHVRERLTVHRMIADEQGICIEITATFTAHADAPDFLVAPLRNGEKVSGHMFVVYAIEDGAIADIQVARIAPISAPSAADV